MVTAAIPAILGSETQAADIASNDKVLVLFADDSIGAALSNDDGVQQLTPLTDPQGRPAQDGQRCDKAHKEQKPRLCLLFSHSPAPSQ